MRDTIGGGAAASAEAGGVECSGESNVEKGVESCSEIGGALFNSFIASSALLTIALREPDV